MQNSIKQNVKKDGDHQWFPLLNLNLLIILRMLNLIGVLAGADRMESLPGALQQQVFAEEMMVW